MRIALWVYIILAGFVCCSCKKNPVFNKPEPKQSSSFPASQATSLESVSILDESICYSSFIQSAPLSESTARTFESSTGQRFMLQGHVLKELSHDEDSRMSVGVVAHLGEEVFQSGGIERYLAFFKKEKVEFIIVLGGVGRHKTQIMQFIKRLLSLQVPVGVLMGYESCRADYIEALQALEKKNPVLLSLEQVRLLSFDDVEFISMPGIHDASQSHCMRPPHCVLNDTEIKDTDAFLKTHPAWHTRTLIGLVPPLQSGSMALDLNDRDGVHWGSGPLLQLIQTHHIRYGLWGASQSVWAHATSLDGTRLIPENQAYESFHLSSGVSNVPSGQPQDAKSTHGTALVVHFKQKQASYSVIHLPHR